MESAQGAGCKKQQAQDQESMARVEPEVGNGPPSLPLTSPSTSTGSGVVAREPQVASPSDTRPTTDQGISFAVRIRGSVIELSG